MATLTYDSKSSTALTADTRSSAGSLTYDSKSSGDVEWRSNSNTWANESRTWGELGLLITLDTRN